MILQDLTCGGLEENTIYAKKNPLITLNEHTNDCMLIMQFLKNSIPDLERITIYGKRIWDILFIAIFFHDIGKGVKGFQEMLLNGKQYLFRHERLSAAIFKQVFSKQISDKEMSIVIRAVLSHHKYCEYLNEILTSELYLGDYEDSIISFESQQKELLVAPIQKYIAQFHLLCEKYIGRTLLKCYLQTLDITKIQDVLKQEIHDYFGFNKLNDDVFFELILWGLLKNCDHMGSARIKSLPVIKQEHQKFLEKITKPYEHQKKCWESTENVLLIAPTGSGKTEAAFGWAFNQINHSGHKHIFYMLPYTASINAMFNRLTKEINNERDPFDEESVVGLVHGKLRQFIADCFDEHSYDEKNIAKISENFRLINKPIKITTPFQILKFIFGVKHFEKGLVELAGAILIYDEIHAYDKETFLKILWSLEWLQHYFKVKVFIATATLPTFLQEMIIKTLKIEKPIKADTALLKSFTRHKVKTIQGTIEENIDLIFEQILLGKKVLIVCNTVDKAQLMFEKIYKDSHLKDEEISLLHSRFIYKDRNIIEKRIMDENSKIRVLIGTQAIEVSLNIDYDVLFSEPAPLDALFQRFGRINRKREKGICQVNIFTTGGKYDHKIYEREIVENTLQVLKDVEAKEEGLILETNLQDMMDQVYKPWDMQDYEIQLWKKDFYNMMERLLPYREHRLTEAEFEKQFKTINVLPHCFYDEYIRLLDEGKYVQAEMLTCQLHMSKLYAGKIRERMKKIDFNNNKINDLWLIECKYDKRMGLLLSEQEEIDTIL